MSLENNVKLGELAREVFSLAETELKRMQKDFDVGDPAHFWEVLSELVDEHLPQEQAPVEELPMSEAEVKSFGLCIFPYGGFKGCFIKDIPLDRLIWYDEHPQEFASKLKRYLKSRKVQDELRL